jgi:hypothetical protein
MKLGKRIRTDEYRLKKKLRLANRSEEEKERFREYQRKWRKENIDKIRAQNKAWEKANPQKVKDKQLRRDFGITLVQYNFLYEEQGGLCKICRASVDVFGGKSKVYLHVDHDHETGKVRGLLCLGCNAGLGYFKDDPKRLELAAVYLRLNA